MGSLTPTYQLKRSLHSEQQNSHLKYGGDDAVVRRVEGDLEGEGVWGEVRAGADLYTRYLQAGAEGEAGLGGLDTGV